MTSPFGILLKQTIAARAMTQRQCALEAKVTQGFVGQIIVGTCRVLLVRVESWADLLALKGAARRTLVILGHPTQTPGFVQAEVAKLLR